MHGSIFFHPHGNQFHVPRREDAADSTSAQASDDPAKRAKEAVTQLKALVADKIASRVDDLAEELLSRGLVAQDENGHYLPTAPPSCAPRYARARNVPAQARRRAEFAVRRGLNRPRTEGRKAFRRGGDAGTLVSTVTGSSAWLWTDCALFRTGLNAATSSTGPGFAPPAGGLQALGVAGGVAAGCSLIDGLDMFNAFLDAVDEQDRRKVEVVVFYRHFQEYLANRASGQPSSPGVVHGFRCCQAALSRCKLFDKAARQAWRRCCAAALRDTGLSTVTALLGVAGMGMKIASGANLASLGLGTAGLALGAVALPLSLACAGIDGVVGRQEISFRKKEYRRCKAHCGHLQQQIDSLAGTDAALRSADHDLLIQVLKGAQKRQRRLMKQARYEMRCGRTRLAKAVVNAAVCTPLATGAIVTGAVATAAVAWPVGVAATVVGGAVGAAYLGSYVGKAASREETRARLRREQYDATLLAATTSAADRARLREEMKKDGKERPLSVAATQGYWIGGRDGFAGRSIHTVSPDTQVVAALDEFAGLLARRPAAGYPELLESHIQAVVALADIDGRLFNDIEMMIRAGSDKLRREGAHPRDIEWQELMARRREYAAVFGLPAEPPKLAPGALLPSFHAACWIVRLGKSRNPEAGKFVKLLEGHLKGEQIDLHAMNEWLDRNGHLARSSALTTDEMWAAAARLFRSVPPALFIDQTQSLLKAVAKETGDRKGFAWQKDSAVHRDLKAFCRFVQTQWEPGARTIRCICSDLDGAAAAARLRTPHELSAALKMLAPRHPLSESVASEAEQAALHTAVREEWTRRFAVETRDAPGLAPDALAAHPSICHEFPGGVWWRNAAGDCYCDLGRQRVAIIRAGALARWIARGDWDRPLPVRVESDAPATAVRWLLRKDPSGVDTRFIEDSRGARTLLEIERAFERSRRPGDSVLRSRLIVPDKGATRDLASPSIHRVVVAGPSMRSSCPLDLLEKLDGSEAEPWRFRPRGGRTNKVGPQDYLDKRYESVEAALQAYGAAHLQEDVRAVFLVNPP
jgi:hypothetical protein